MDLDIQWRYSDLEEDSNGWKGRLDLVYQFASGTMVHDVAPFGFLRWGGSLAAEDPDDGPTVRHWNGEFAIGAGVSWKPYERVSLWVRQGIAASRWWMQSNPSSPTGTRWTKAGGDCA